MKLSAFFPLLPLLAGLLSGPLQAEDPGLKGPGLEVKLISENSHITAGEPFVVGLHLEHFPGFHTYWRNPGVVGMETSLKWDLPEGFSASGIRWPYPENTFMGQYPCHGYERDVTLLVTITPPEKIPDDSVTLSAEAAWMCCAVGCFPGFETLSLTLPVSDSSRPNPDHKKLIQKAIAELPSTDHSITANLVSQVDAPTIRIIFRNKEKWEEGAYYFFSSDRQISSDQPQEFVNRDDGSLLLEIPRSEFSPKGKITIPGVLKIGSEVYALEAKPRS